MVKTTLIEPDSLTFLNKLQIAQKRLISEVRSQGEEQLF